jgi:polar amino acid transport system ATP-binding protein
LSDTAPTPVIELRSLHKSYGDLKVLKGVDLIACKGDVIALIGSSGSGKSTLLRCVNLLEVAQKGDIVIGGEPVIWNREDIYRQPKDAEQVRRFRTNLSMVFQQFNLWSHLNVLQNVIEAPVTVLGRNKTDAAQLGRALLNQVGIGDKVDMYPSQLSGGQQQRAAIARALAMEPSAMLFDEPTSALDPETEAEVVAVIRDLAAEGRTMLLVTHDMKLARDVANHVIFLHQGVIEEQGTPEEVFDLTKSKRLQQFLSSTY